VLKWVLEFSLWLVFPGFGINKWVFHPTPMAYTSNRAAHADGVVAAHRPRYTKSGSVVIV